MRSLSLLIGLGFLLRIAESGHMRSGCGHLVGWEFMCHRNGQPCYLFFSFLFFSFLFFSFLLFWLLLTVSQAIKFGIRSVIRTHITDPRQGTPFLHLPPQVDKATTLILTIASAFLTPYLFDMLRGLSLNTTLFITLAAILFRIAPLLITMFLFNRHRIACSGFSGFIGSFFGNYYTWSARS
jgi:hypothetical protein